MINIWKIFKSKGSSTAYALLTAIFTIVPDDFFKLINLNLKYEIIIIRILVSIIVFSIANIIYYIYIKKRKKVVIDDKNYRIQIEYGDLFDIKSGKIIINFDECFTTKVGDAPGDIKPNSICGQYLSKYPISNMEVLIHNAGVKPDKGKSEYKQQTKYESGIIVPEGDYLLMAFAKLNKDGLGGLTYDQLIKCLNTLWQQIDLHHGTSDVYMPILGSKITRFEKELTQQELLDIIIASYRLSPKKLKKPYTLHICCKERDGFSLNDTFGVK